MDKKYIFLFSALFVSVLLAAYFGWKYRGASFQQGREGSAVESSDEAMRRMEQERFTEESRAYEAMKQAIIEKDLEKCRKMKDSRKDDCLLGIFGMTGDFSYCQEITNPDKKSSCEEMPLYKSVVEGGKAERCSELKSSLRGECLELFFTRFRKEEDCSGLEKADRERCRDFVSRNMALDSGSVSACDKISNEALRSDCVLVASGKPGDADADGLPDGQEISYGTDPFRADTDGDGLEDLAEMSKLFTDPKNPDTDGDGFKDGDEASGGFDPLKPGGIKKTSGF